MKITDKEILQINRLYKKYGTYAAVAREVGCGPATVKKYINPNFVELDETKFQRFTKEDLPKIFRTLEVTNLGELCNPDKSELNELEELRKEILI